MRLKHRAGWLLLMLAVYSLGAAGRDTLFAQAARSSDKAAVRALLQNDIDVNASEPDGTTALHRAVHRDDLETVDLLIRVGANVKAANRYGVMPLSLACTNGNATIVERLLNAGADPNAALPGGETALMTAARTGKPEVLKALLAHGANPNAREGARAQTALMWAAAENNAEAVKVLVEAGADIHARTSEPGPAQAAASATATGVFSRATRVAAPSGARGLSPSFTAFLFAVQLGQMDAARALLQVGADVNETLPDGTSALVLATMNGNWELGALLADKGADVNASAQGWTALHQIARLRRTNIGFGLPPPVGTGNLSSLDLVRKLIAHGADVNARMTKDFRDGYRNRLNRVGVTPFLLAAKNVDTELMRVLLAVGADPLLPNADKTTPLMVAAGVDIWNPGEDAGSGPDSEPEALEAVKMLVELGNDVQAVNDRGETALHGAAYRGANSIVQYLVEKGAKLDVKSTQGWTPWTIANGVFYSLFFKEQRATANLLAQLMAERGLSTEGMIDEGRTCFDCERNDRVLRDAEGRRVAQPKPAAVAVAQGARAAAQDARKTVWDGIYIGKQAKRGQEAYKRVCGHCHRDDLSGGGSDVGAPALVGPLFTVRWRDQPLVEMFVTIGTTMPQNNPDTLTPETVIDIVSFLLEANEMPAGKAELPADLEKLKEIFVTERPPR